MKKLFILVLSLLVLFSCSKEQSVGDRYRASVKPPGTMYIYGGANGNVYLGKLNASRFDVESIWNRFGTYGNRFNTNSIWNAYGSYGSDYSSYSPFNAFATKPPVLYDAYGNFHGYFTCNRNNGQRANYELVNIICEYYKDIREDVSDWYDKIF